MIADVNPTGKVVGIVQRNWKNVVAAIQPGIFLIFKCNTKPNPIFIIMHVIRAFLMSLRSLYMNLILEPYVDLKKLEIHFLALKRLISSDFLGSEHLRNLISWGPAGP